LPAQDPKRIGKAGRSRIRGIEATGKEAEIATAAERSSPTRTRQLTELKASIDAPGSQEPKNQQLFPVEEKDDNVHQPTTEPLLGEKNPGI
jgi:hypothetical protein